MSKLSPTTLGVLRRLAEGPLRCDGVTDQQRDAIRFLKEVGAVRVHEGEVPPGHPCKLYVITDTGIAAL